MRKTVSLILLLTVFAQGCASSGTSPSSAAGAAPGSTAAANRALQGQSAKIELADGQVILGAKDVEMGPGSTSWSGGSVPGLHDAPTATVRKVTIESRRKTLRWLGYGAVIGGALFLLGGTEGDDDPSGTTDAFGGEVAVGSVVLGGLIGAAIGAARKTPEKVVYEVRDNPAAEERK